MNHTIPPHFIEVSPGHWTHPSNIQGAPQTHANPPQSDSVVVPATKPPKPRLNKTEARWKAIMMERGVTGIIEQAITLKLDPPFKSYTPDLAHFNHFRTLCFVEVKGPHRFREKGIAKAALAAKTYPQFKFELADWTGKEWRESVFSP